mmetsp:Transcript_44852/g.174077  ORF Transcript_44852/g.174077 Transcript_44852/m.174077 type:complete len:168 (-) Transcript_44852:2199-2702(-)|eukprot:CAMPEP_0113971436 /NCGR_PEP_ID=MMETSP0011_2-20120614/12250_1 /TAXON_ID=101924 /ORGANISM="Rhodosorus marinus" /LENGTH=167 /DNA_ID=CAMNT_0000986961 /DNA_START=30 /DNA_END=533 /DNA_ORIENTATION=+ /assembly_acc=CAM_ASM_000156
MKAWQVLLAIAVFALLASPVVGSDDPDDAWEEWGETKSQKEKDRQRPRFQPQVDMRPGKKVNIDSLMGSVPKKLQLFFVKGNFASVPACNARVAQWREQLRIGAVEANISCVQAGEEITIVGRAESQRDAHNAKDFLLRFDEVTSVKIDTQEFTEPLVRGDEDEDDL